LGIIWGRFVEKTGGQKALATVPLNDPLSPKERKEKFCRHRMLLNIDFFLVIIVNTSQPRFRRCFSGLILTRKKIIARHFHELKFSPHIDRLKARSPCDARGGPPEERTLKIFAEAERAA
jgi:hypothetical protein